MKRRIVGVAGSYGEVVLADDGTMWLWTPDGWREMKRPPLPDSPALDYFDPPWPITMGVPAVRPEGPVVASDVEAGDRFATGTPPVPPKRGPGRPRKS